MRNQIRIISDVGATPVPVEPALDPHGQPLDLSLSALRSVSPIHLEYLANMGVAASALPAAQDTAIASSLGLTRAELVAGWQRWLEPLLRTRQ